MASITGSIQELMRSTSVLSETGKSSYKQSKKNHNIIKSLYRNNVVNKLNSAEKLYPFLRELKRNSLENCDLSEVDFALLPEADIIEIILGNSEDEVSIEKRFSSMTSDQLKVVVKKVHRKLWFYFPCSLLSLLPLSEMSSVQIEEIFCHPSLFEEDRIYKISKLSPKVINDILSKVSPNFLKNITRLQIQELDFSKITKKQLMSIFSPSKVWKIAFVPASKINLFMAKSPLPIFLHLTEKQIKALDQKQIGRLKTVFIDYEKKLEHAIPFLDYRVLNAWLFHGFYQILEYIPYDKIPHINLADVPDRCLDVFFPPITAVNLSPDYSHSFKCDPSGTMHAYQYISNSKNKNFDFFKLNSSIIKLIKFNESLCLHSYKMIEQVKFNEIKGKLNKEIVRFIEMNNDL